MLGIPNLWQNIVWGGSLCILAIVNYVGIHGKKHVHIANIHPLTLIKTCLSSYIQKAWNFLPKLIK